MKKLVIVDIDGTISTIGDRLKYLKQTPKDYESFYADDFDDEPIQEMCDLVSILKHHYDIVFLTGRRDSAMLATEKWIRKHIFKNVFEDYLGMTLIMRPSNDHRKDIEVKIDQFLKAGLKVEDIAFVLEDRDSMVEMWRNLGVKCLQVCNGNY